MKKYHSIGSLVQGFSLVEFNKKIGFINKYNVEICACIYDAAGNFINGFAFVILNSNHGYINENGIEVVECKYSTNEAYGMLNKYCNNLIRKDKLNDILK